MESEDEGNQEVPPETTSSTSSLVPSTRHSRSSLPATPLPATPKSLTSHWQLNCTNVLERNSVLFNNELMADVFFNVGAPPNVQGVPAHKYVLASGSSVFFAMFYGGLSDQEKREIDIPDVEPAAFRTLLRYLYCDAIELEPDTVLSTLYAAKKYIVPHMARQCVQYLESSLSARNACVLLSQSRLFEEVELMRHCWEVIDAQAEESLKSEGFTDIDHHTLEMVLARETLNAREVSVFKAVLRWADAECVRQNLESTSGNKRQVLGKALYLLRVPTMELLEFADTVANTGVLTLQETNDVFMYFTATKKPTLPFISRPRRGLQSQRCHRFLSSAYRSNQWRYRGRCDSIQFCVDKRIFVAGFGLYGSSNGHAEYKVKAELKRSGVAIGKATSKFYSDGTNSTFPVYFDNPIQVEPEIFYTASTVLEGSELGFFGQEGTAERTVGAVTFQFQCSAESTNGTGVQGGQIPEIIFYS